MYVSHAGMLYMCALTTMLAHVASVQGHWRCVVLLLAAAVCCAAAGVFGRYGGVVWAAGCVGVQSLCAVEAPSETLHAMWMHLYGFIGMYAFDGCVCSKARWHSDDL
jgi:hypothetical protein